MHQYWQYFELTNNMDGTANHEREYKEIVAWCEEHFGPMKESGWEILRTPFFNRNLGIGGRITKLECRFFTSNPEFITLFKLRWV